MEFKEAAKQIQLNERTVGEVADGWEAFRNRYTGFLKSKGPQVANNYAEQWLGEINGFKGIDNLKSRLESIGVKLEPKVDDILFKVVDRINAGNVKDVESKKNRQQEIEKAAAERQEKLKGRRAEVVQREADAEAREAKLAKS
jgi:hypothetical protein